jgi:plastocyanin
MADGQKSPATHVVYIIIIIVLLVVVAGEYFYFHNKQQSAMMAANHPAMNGQMMPPGKGKDGINMAMMAVKPPPLSDQQNQQLTEGTSKSTTQKTFNITAGNFYFVPNKITVNKGDKVTFNVTNAGGVHDLVINELGIKTPVAKTATTETYTFSASKTGSFVYYCSVPGHRQKGMWGTLTVQ